MDDDVMVFRRPSLPNLDDLALKTCSIKKANRDNDHDKKNDSFYDDRIDSSFYRNIRSVAFDSRHPYPSACDFIDIDIDNTLGYQTVFNSKINGEKSIVKNGIVGSGEILNNVISPNVPNVVSHESSPSKTSGKGNYTTGTGSKEDITQNISEGVFNIVRI